MSADFRAVREIWGEPCGAFLEHDALLSFLEVIADSANTRCRSDEYSDKTALFVANGTAFVDYVESNPEFTTDFMMAQLGDQGHTPDAESLDIQVKNAKVHASEWRRNISEDGTLRFYVD